MPGPCKLAVQVKGVGLHRTHLHPANVEALWPTMRHAIHFFGLLTQTTIAREKDSNLSFFCTAPKPRTSFLFEHSPKDSFLEMVNCCRMSSTGKSSQSILSLPMRVERFFSSSIAPRWKCNSLLLTASLLWAINLAVSEAIAGASNYSMCLLRCFTSRPCNSRNASGDQWAGNQTLRKSTGQSAPSQSVIVVS